MKLDTVKKLGGAEETESAPIPDELCASDTIDRQEIAELVKRLPDLQVSNYMVEIFKLLGDSTRLQIVVALLQRDLCVHDLVELLAQARSAKAEPIRGKNASATARCTSNDSQALHTPSRWHFELIVTRSVGALFAPAGTCEIFCTTSMPSATRPKIVYLPVSAG